jgi:hypothetical protein
VRAAPIRAMVADRWVSPWGGGETAMATAINAMRTVTARSPAWTRGGKKRGVLSLAWPFEAEAGEAGEGWGSVGTTRLVEGKTGKREGAPGVAGAARAAGISPPGRRVRATVLQSNCGGRRGTVDSVRAAER